MSALDDVAGAALIKARPWDVVGAAVGALMLVWGLLGWFGTVGDSGSGVPGFYSGPGAAGIGLVLAASALATNQILAGRAHTSAAPPVSVLLAGAASIVILGGMLAKPGSTTIQAGSVAGLMTALTQVLCLTVGWVKGSGKAVKAAKVAAWQAQQAAAERATALPAMRSTPQYGSGISGYPPPAPPYYPTGAYPPVPGTYPPPIGYPPQ
jgi:hypothetical protein